MQVAAAVAAAAAVATVAAVAVVAAVAAVAMTSIQCSAKSGKQDFMLGGDWRGHALSHHSRHA